MPKITIDMDKESGNLLLYGDIGALISNRYANRYLRDFLNPMVESDNIILKCEKDKVEQTLANVQSMLRKYGFEEGKSEIVGEQLATYYEEEERFKSFSRKALDIRNNICDKEDFQRFTNALEEYIPNRTLYGLQLLSAYHLAFAQNACNFSVPGAGKTSIVYGAYAYLKNLPKDDPQRVDKLLIVGPLSSFGPWELEYNECFGRYPQVKRLTSALTKEEKSIYLYSNTTAELTLISYASLASVKDDIAFFLRNNRVMVVLDEAHKVKNTSGGVTAKAVLEVSKFCSARVVLTGTPAPNGYEDLYNMFKFIWPTKNVIKYHVNQLRDMTTTSRDPRVEGLIESISPFFIRIKKSDLKIPEAIMRPPIEVEMGQIQRKIYDFIEKKYIDSIINSGEIDLTSKFKKTLLNAKMIRLMQAATNPAMLNSPLISFMSEDDIPSEAYRAIDDASILSEIMKYPQLEIPEKFKEASKLIQQIIDAGGKVVVWATFIQTIKDFNKYLESCGIASQMLYGAVPVENHGIDEENEEQDILTREKIVREFHKTDCPFKVIIANPFAVAESISLHKACHNAIYIERTFNAAHFMQSKDRIHRYGLKETDITNYYFLISKDSIDEVVDERLMEKERRMIEIIESMPIPLFDNITDDLGDEDIKVLIKNYVKRTNKV
ncbi:MAG: DEAD/DEAH box helicase [Bacillota bacterium]